MALDAGSAEIFLDDKFTKYLKRPRSHHAPPAYDANASVLGGSASSAATTVSVGPEEMGGAQQDNVDPDFENMSYLEFRTNYIALESEGECFHLFRL